MGKIKTSKEIINKIILLREQGGSISEISYKLHVPKTTVFKYVQGIILTSDISILLNAKRGGSRLKKIAEEQFALDEGIRTVGILSDKEMLLYASALYWAEGNKKDLIITNSDPDLIKVFIAVARKLLHVKEVDMQVSIRLYEDIDKNMSLLFWSEITGINIDNFLTTHILPGKKLGKLKYGMCRLRIKKGGKILKKIVGINRAVVSQI